MFGRADAFYGVDVCRPISSSLQQRNSPATMNENLLTIYQTTRYNNSTLIQMKTFRL